MNNTITVKKLELAAKQRSEQAALALPGDVIRELCDRAVEAVGSGEPHKCTGGWVAMPFIGKYSANGLLLAAWRAVQVAQQQDWSKQ